MERKDSLRRAKPSLMPEAPDQSYQPALDRLVPLSVKPALSAAATSDCAKLPLVSIESSEELTTLDLRLEKIRSSSDADPHPFTIEPKNKGTDLMSSKQVSAKHISMSRKKEHI